MFELQSPEIDKIMDAIAEMHDKCGVTIEKDAKGARNATYAKLDNILTEIHRRCKEFKLTLIQRKLISDSHDKSAECLETLLFHRESKQWLKSLSLLHVNPQATSPDQVWGGSDTYHRRYDAMGILGLCSSDDPADHDGWKDHGETTPVVKQQSNVTMIKPSSISPVMNIINGAKSDLISVNQLAKLKFELKGYEDLETIILEQHNVSKLADIPWKKFQEILAFLDANKS